jgi:hypothetical protein
LISHHRHPAHAIYSAYIPAFFSIGEISS